MSYIHAGTSPTISAPRPPPPTFTTEHIPLLKLDGSNWAIFAFRFREAMEAFDWWSYFDGANPRPVPKDPQNVTEEEKEDTKRWEREDCVARYLLSQCLPDYTALRMSNYPTAQSRWDRIHDEFTRKSAFVQNRLETAFYDMRCQRGGDVRAFLTNLRHKHEELAAAGGCITNRDYLRIALRGLPEDLATFASSCHSAVRIAHCASTLDIELFFDYICAEADRLKNRRARSQRNGRCNRCGQAGHREHECRLSAREEGRSGEGAQRPEERHNSEAIPVSTTSTRVAVLTTDEDGCYSAFDTGARSG